MQLFSNLSKLLTILCFHKNFMTIFQTVKELSRSQTDTTENIPPRYAITFFSQSVLHCSVAVSTICRHSSRVVAFLQAVARPKFRGPRSGSIARSQVWLGLPADHFQSGDTCRIHAARARWWFSRGDLRAI